jgi:hypothetical protein
MEATQAADTAYGAESAYSHTHALPPGINGFNREFVGGGMIVRRRTWSYRLHGQMFAQTVAFDQPVTAAGARAILRRTVGEPMELWGRATADLLQFYR